MIRLSNWESHIERPDTDFPDYYKYFGDEPELLEVEPYTDDEIDEIVDYYAKTGPADPEYMEEVKAKWSSARD